MDTNKAKNQFKEFRKYYKSVGPMFEKEQNRSYTAVIFSFLAISLFGWYAVRPTIQTILTLKREIADKTIVNQQMEQKIAVLIDAQNLYQEIQPLLPLLSAAIPEDTNPTDVVSQLQTLIANSGGSLNSLSVSKIPLSNPVTKTANASVNTQPRDFTLTLSITGPYSTLENILFGIANMRRIITIQSITIQPASRSSESNPTSNEDQLTMALSVKSYYQPR